MTGAQLTILMNGLSPRPLGKNQLCLIIKKPGRALREGKEGRTCFAKDGEFTLLPASLVYVGFRWH